MAPQTVGDNPWKIIYDVTVKLISSGVVLKSVAIVGIEGLYIFEAKPEKDAATDTIITITIFCPFVNIE
jgi:hypothetical protein